jgi:hypothetical protein
MGVVTRNARGHDVTTERLPLYLLRVAVQTLSRVGSPCRRERNVESTSAALQSGVQLWASLGTHLGGIGVCPA